MHESEKSGTDRSGSPSSRCNCVSCEFGTAPVLLASTVGASVTSVVADVMTPSKGGSMPTAASCAPDNFWTLLGDLVSMGGWLLILILVVPMVLGWILPGPLERRKKT